MIEATSPVHLEMGYSVDEFERVLPKAMRDWTVKGRNPQWSVNDDSGSELASISIEPRAERVAGAMRLPVLQVRITFEMPASARVVEMLRRFERGFHRGGG